MSSKPAFQPLVPTRSQQAADLESGLRERVIGQDEAINKVVDAYETFSAGLHAPGRPVANIMLLGATGMGKTRVVEAMAETLFGDARAVIKIDCGELQHSHEVAKLIGSPPGYLGHRETAARLTQEALNQWHTEKLKLTIVLFDEIEKASDSVWQLLLGILDKATLTLGDNRRVDFSQCMVFMTSNIGAKDLHTAAIGTGFGFAGRTTDATGADWDRKKNDIAINALKRKFSPEFINRLDNTIVFNNLTRENVERILELELGAVQQRLNDRAFVFGLTPQAKDALIEQGFDAAMGGRALKRTIEREIVQPLAALVAGRQIQFGDFIRVRHHDGKFVFGKEGTAPVDPFRRPRGVTS